MLLDLGLQTEGKFQKVLEACQYPEKSKGPAGKRPSGKNGKAPFPGSKEEQVKIQPSCLLHSWTKASRLAGR